MNKWVLRVSSLIVVALLLLLGTTSVMAAAPDEAALASEQTFLVEISVAEDGSWTLGMGGVPMGVGSETFNAVSKRFGLGMASPIADPATLEMAETLGICQLAVAKEGDTTSIWINGEPLAALTLGDAAIATVTQSFVPELEGLVAWVNMTHVAVVIDLPCSATTSKPDLSKSLTVAAPAAPANLVNVAATVSPEGELLSIAGLSPETLGMAAPVVDTTMVDTLGIDSVDVSVGQSRLRFDANDEMWATLHWNTDLLLDMAPVAFSMGGMPYDEQTAMYLDVAASWMDDTDISASVAFAETPTDGAPIVSLSRPVLVEVAGDGAVAVEGIPTGAALDAQSAATLDAVGSVGLVWAGHDGQVRVTMGEKLMPYLEVADNFVPTVGETFVGDVLPVSWDWIGDLFSQTQFGVGVVTEGGSVPSVELVSYEAQPSAPTVIATAEIVVAPNGVAFFGEPLPLGVVDALAGTTVSDSAALAYDSLAGVVDTAAVSLGPAGLDVGLNDTRAALRWDDALRNNLVDLAVAQATEPLDIPAALDLGLVRGIVQAVVGFVNQAELAVTVQVTDEPLQEGFVETLAGWILGT